MLALRTNGSANFEMMKRKGQFLILLILCGIPEILSAQFTFQKTFTTVGGATCQAGCYTSDGNYVFAGSSYSGGINAFDLIKVNELGDTIWTKKYDFGNSQCMPRSVREGINGKLIVFGTIYQGNSDAFCFNTDSVGNLLWTKRFNYTNEDGIEVTPTTDSGYIACGWCTSTLPFGVFDAFVIKLDQNGSMVWSRRYQHNDWVWGFSIENTSDGGYIIGGVHRDGGGFVERSLLIKVNSIGNLIWSKKYNLAGWGQKVRRTFDGGYAFTGYDPNATNTKVFLIKTDSIGNPAWQKEYFTVVPDYVQYFEQTTDSGYILVGRAGGLGISDYFIIKTDVNGDTIWTRHYGTSADEIACFIHKTNDNGYFIGGYSDTLTYLIKTDSVGYSGCTLKYFPITVNTVSPVFSANAPIIVTPATWTESSPSPIISSGGAISTLCSTVGLNEISVNISYPLIFPNPTTGIFTVRINNIINNGSIAILNVFGQKIFEENIFNESKKEINLKNISEGIYFVKVFDGEKSYCRKIIVE